MWTDNRYWAIETLLVQAGISHLAPLRTAIGQIDSQGQKLSGAGAGPIGLLAALLSTQQGLKTHVLDPVTDDPKPDLVRDIGATHHNQPVGTIDVAADVVLECTGLGQVAPRRRRMDNRPAKTPDDIKVVVDVQALSA